MAQRFTARFWGVRGSIACPGSGTVRYGGNTSCIEVRCGERLVILDAGTGLRELGGALQTGSGPVKGDILLSHTHLDHIAGIPFFSPAFNPANRFTFWAGHLGTKKALYDVIADMMQPPLFPVPVEIMQADITFQNFQAGTTLDLGDEIKVRTAALNHPNGATGFRISFGGRSLCYVTDTEHHADRLDATILDLIRDADVFIYDSTYTDEEYPRFKGWGHSTWQAGAALAEEARVARYVVFHHDPSHDDTAMDRIAVALKQRLPNALVSREGMCLDLEGPGLVQVREP